MKKIPKKTLWDRDRSPRSKYYEIITRTETLKNWKIKTASYG